MLNKYNSIFQSLSQRNDESSADNQQTQLRKSPKSLRQLYPSSAAPTINQSITLILFINMALRVIL